MPSTLLLCCLSLRCTLCCRSTRHRQQLWCRGVAERISPSHAPLTRVKRAQSPWKPALPPSSPPPPSQQNCSPFLRHTCTTTIRCGVRAALRLWLLRRSMPWREKWPFFAAKLPLLPPALHRRRLGRTVSVSVFWWHLSSGSLEAAAVPWETQSCFRSFPKASPRLAAVRSISLQGSRAQVCVSRSMGAPVT
jgi:hypothetical protein